MACLSMLLRNLSFGDVKYIVLANHPYDRLTIPYLKIHIQTLDQSVYSHGIEINDITNKNPKNNDYSGFA